MKKRFTFILTLTALLCLGTGNVWGEELTVANKTNYNSYCPLYGNWADAYQRCQVIYLSSELAAMNGNNITGMTFYLKTIPTKAWSGSEYHILLSEVTASSFSGSWNTEVTGTEVLTCASLDGTSGTLTLTFTTPYTYNGGNLLFELQDKGTGEYSNSSFYGDSNLGNRSVSNYNSSSFASVSATNRAFLPKTTFTYEPAGAVSCPKPKSLTKGEVTATSATFTWTKGGDETSWQWICLPAATAVDWNSANVQTTSSPSASVSGLSANTDYKFYLRADCGSEQSAELVNAFTTPCADYATANLPFEQNFNGLTAGTGLIPDCWSKVANGNYPYIYSSGGVDNSKSLYFSGGASATSSIIILPHFEAPTNSLVISLAYKNSSGYSYYAQFKIGYMTNPEDASTFVSLKALERKDEWTEENKFALTSAPANSYIAIQYAGGSYTGTGYLDNIKVALPSSCTDPSGLTAVAASSTSATVSWTENGSASAWNIQYSTDNFATHTDFNNVSTNPYNLTGLSGNTTYKVRVQSNCGGEQSDWIVSSEFTTPCESVDGIGFTQDFESETAGSGKIPGCWQKITNNNSYPQISSTSSYQKAGSTKCLYFYGGVTGSSEQIAILPPFNEATNTLYVTLDYNNAYYDSYWGETYDYSGSNYGQLSIGYVINSTFTPQESLPRVSAYATASVALTNAPAGSRVAIRYSGGSSAGYLFVDNITISAIPSCVAPSGVSCSATASDEISVSWTANGSESAWKIQNSSDNGTSWSGEIAASTNPFTLTGLSGNTDYIVRVKAICSGEDVSEWSSPSAPIHTPCGAVDASDYHETFEASATGSGKLPDCWQYKESVYLYSTTYPYVYSGSSYAYAGNNSLYFYGGISGSSEQSVLLPAMDAALNSLTIEFYYKDAESPWSTLAKFVVGYIAADGETFVAVETLNYADNYTKYKKNLSSVPADAKYIAIRYAGGASSVGYGYLDNVRVYPTPNCIDPSGVTVSNVTSTTADVAWTENNSATVWKLQISNDGSSWTDVNGGADITTNPYQLTNLAPNQTTYYVRVKSICGASDESPWSATSAPFQTECEARSMPFSENFNGLTAGIPTCWDNSEGTTATASYKWNYYATGHEGAGVQFDSYNNPGDKTNILKTPAITISEAAMLDFWYMNAAGGDLSVYYSIDGVKQDAALASGLTGKSEWTQASFNLPNTCVGHDVVIMFQGTSNYGYSNIFLDDIQVIEQPACPAVNVTTLAASAVTANSATIAWTAGDAETAWNLQYKADGGEWSDVVEISTTPSCALSGLAANTLYFVRVQANCSDATSAWTADDAFSFRTDCEAVAVSKASPWECNFDEAENNKMPSCWERVEPYDDYGYPYVDEYAYYASSGTKYLYFRTPGRSGSSYTEDAILPIFNTEIKNLKVSFSYFNSGTTSNYGQLAIGYVVGDAFTQVGDLVAKVDDYTLVEREMPNDAPDGARIAIRCIGSTKGSSYTTTVYVDDIQVSLKPTCYTPTDLAAVATSNGAVLTWTAGKDETEWQVRYSVKDEDSWTVVSDIASTTHTLTGLTVDVAYEAQVRSSCGGEDYSAWSASVNFTPVCGAAPTNLAVSARTTNSATLTWESAESAFLLQTSLDGDNWESPINVNAKTYNLIGLNAGTTYYARVQNACGGEYASASFTTWCGLKDAAELPLEINNFTAVPECWQIAFVGEYSGIANDKIFFYGDAEQMAVLPAYDIELNKLSVTFSFTPSATNLEFGYIDEPNGAFHAFASQPASDVELNLENEAATAKYIAIRYHDGGAYTSASITGVQLRKTPTCLKPTDVTVVEDVDQATVSWTSTATAWNLQYKLASAAAWQDATGTITNPFTLSGLEQGTNYKVRVQAACAGDELSDWSDEAEFTTSCSGIASIPWDADFSTNLSNCWTIHCESPEYYSPMISSGGLLIPGGNGGHSNVVVLPGFSTDIKGATITLRYQCDAAAGNAAPQIGYVTVKSDASTFAVLTDGTDQIGTLEKSSGYKTVYLPLSALPDEASNLAIRYAGGSSEGNLTINEFRVSHVEIFEDVEGASDNQTRLEALNGQTLDIVLTRSVWRNGDYGTISLPFNLSAAQLADSKCPLNGFAIREYKESEVNTAGNIVDIYLQDVSEITAGDAYFVRYDGSLANLSPLHFRDVTVSSYEPNNTNDGNLSLFGLFNPLAVEANDYGTLFVGSGNALYYPNVAGYIKGFRAYFTVPTSSPLHAPIRNGAPIRISEQKNTPTGFENTEEGHSAQSVKIVENGQLFIIRNGVKYDAQGKKVQ